LWELLHEAFNDSGGGNPSLKMIDSSIIRAHHCSAGAKGGLRFRIPPIARQGERSGQAQPFKRWLYDQNPSPHQCNTMGLSRALALTGGEVCKYKGYMSVMNADGPAPNVLLADKGYGADFMCHDMAKRGGVAMIPTKRNRLIQFPSDTAIYALATWASAASTNSKKNTRRLATRYDKTADSYLGFILIVSIRLWMRQSVNARYT
jgi:transposase